MAYGGGLENRFRLFGERGFESHPLRHLRWLAHDGERLFMPDKSGNYESRFNPNLCEAHKRRPAELFGQPGDMFSGLPGVAQM